MAIISLIGYNYWLLAVSFWRFRPEHLWKKQLENGKPKKISLELN